MFALSKDDGIPKCFWSSKKKEIKEKKKLTKYGYHVTDC